jgi:hypothetical protein
VAVFQLGWIPAVYTDTEDLKRAGQRIVYLTNPHSGHLGIFVSASVSLHDHLLPEKWIISFSERNIGAAASTHSTINPPPEHAHRVRRQSNAHCRGLTGGVWATRFLADLGNGRFDGAWLAQNFEALKPAKAIWEKYANLFTRIDSERERFLEFERWWGGYYWLSGKRWLPSSKIYSSAINWSKAKFASAIALPSRFGSEREILLTHANAF